MRKLVYGTLAVSALSILMLMSCEDKPSSPFDRYPHSDFYRYYDEVCVDSFIDSVGNPHFIFRNENGVLSDCELDDTLVVIDRYLVPGIQYTPEQIKKIRKK